MWSNFHYCCCWVCFVPSQTILQRFQRFAAEEEDVVEGNAAAREGGQFCGGVNPAVRKKRVNDAMNVIYFSDGSNFDDQVNRC